MNPSSRCGSGPRSRSATVVRGRDRRVRLAVPDPARRGAGHLALRRRAVVFVVLLPLLAAVVLAELTAGGIDAKAVAMLGMLAAVGGALRALGPGTAGLEPSFAVIILGGRVFGRGFGFVLGAVTLFAGALLTGGVGPVAAVPDDRRRLGRLLRRLPAAVARPRRGGHAGGVRRSSSGWPSALVMNLWFWPFASYGPETSLRRRATRSPTTWRRYLRLLRDHLAALGPRPRGAVRAGRCCWPGRALLRALRRASRRAAFDARRARSSEPHRCSAPASADGWPNPLCALRLVHRRAARRPAARADVGAARRRRCCWTAARRRRTPPSAPGST